MPYCFENPSPRHSLSLIGRASHGHSFCWTHLDARAASSAIAFEPKLDAATDWGKANQIAKLGRAPDRRAIDSLHDVALLQPRLLRRRTTGNLRDQRPLIALLGRNIDSKIADGYADLAATNFAVLNKLLHDAAGHVDRHSESDSDVTPARRNDRRIDPDKLSPQVNQGAARISGINGCVGLDEVLIPLLAKAGSAEGADNSRSYGLTQAEGVPDRDHEITDLDPIAVTQRDGLEVTS